MHKLESKEQRHLWNIHNTRVRTLKGSVKLKILETDTFLTVYSFDLINAANAVQLIFFNTNANQADVNKHFPFKIKAVYFVHSIRCKC